MWSRFERSLCLSYIVDELPAAAAHQQAKKIEKTALEEYLAGFPEPQEALIYQNWCSG